MLSTKNVSDTKTKKTNKKNAKRLRDLDEKKKRLLLFECLSMSCFITTIVNDNDLRDNLHQNDAAKRIPKDVDTFDDAEK